MHLSTLLDMAREGMADRVASGSRSGGCTMKQLADRAERSAACFAASPGDRVGLVDLNSELVAVAFFGAALAGKPYVPINYRLPDAQLRAIVARTAPSTAIVGDGVAERLGDVDGVTLVPRDAFAAVALATDGPRLAGDAVGGNADDVAVLLYRLRSTKNPERVELRDALPCNETGMLRRVLREELTVAGEPTA